MYDFEKTEKIARNGIQREWDLESLCRWNKKETEETINTTFYKKEKEIVKQLNLETWERNTRKSEKYGQRRNTLQQS